MNITLARTGDFVGSGRGAAALVGGSLTILFVLRIVLFPGIGGDEGEQLVFSQFFDWGYQVRNPPLITWLVIAVSQVTGPTAVAVAVVKIVALGLMYTFLWKCALHVLQDARLAALAAASPLTLYYIGWDAIFGYTHSILVTMFYVATLWLVIRIETRGKRRDFVWLGVVVAGGLLSKYVFAVFLLALLAACAGDRTLRQRLFQPALLISLLVSTVLLFPHMMWLANTITLPDGGPLTGPKVSDVTHLIFAIIGFLSPFWLVVFGIFPTSIAARPDVATDEYRYATLLERYFLILCAVALVAIALFHNGRLRTHYMFILLPLIIYFFLKIKAAPPRHDRCQLFGITLLVFAALSIVGMVVKFVAEPLKCDRCQHHIPYQELASALRKAGFVRGTIVAYWHPDPIAGNLRIQFKDSRVISTKHPMVQPPPGRHPGQCVLVWPVSDAKVGRGSTIAMANRYLGTSIPAQTSGKEVSAPLKMGRGKQVALGYILVNSGAGTCR